MKVKKNRATPVIGVHIVELVSLRIAEIHSCPYCIDIHYRELKYFGETETRISSIPFWKEVACFSKKEKAVIALTDELVNLQRENPSVEVYNQLLYHFIEEEIYALGLAIKQMSNWTGAMKNY